MEEKLIEAVRVRKVLYDTSHGDYLKTKLKAEKWEEVAKETDIRSGKLLCNSMKEERCRVDKISFVSLPYFPAALFY